MKLKAIEKKKDKWKLEIEGEDHALLNLLRENAWKAGAKQASYAIEHPYLSTPVITVRGPNPKKLLADSAKFIIDDAKVLQREAKRVLD